MTTLDSILDEIEVSILDGDGNHTDTLVVAQVLSGSGFYTDMVGDMIVMIDEQDENEVSELGTTVEIALKSLSGYIEYFNGLEDEEPWDSDFLYSLDNK